jgi:hypothetical protein
MGGGWEMKTETLKRLGSPAKGEWLLPYRLAPRLLAERERLLGALKKCVAAYELPEQEYSGPLERATDSAIAAIAFAEADESET